MNALQVIQCTKAYGYHRLCTLIREWHAYQEAVITLDGRIFVRKTKAFVQLTDDQVFDLLLWLDGRA